MKNYYCATYRVFVDGVDFSLEIVKGQGFDPNIVKGIAEDRVRQYNIGKIVTAVLIDKIDMDLEEFKKYIGGTPGWLGGPSLDI